MAILVDEVMNRELLSVREGDSRETVMNAILGFGVTAVPVLDARGQVIGIVSLRDLLAHGTSGYNVSKPAITVRSGTTIADAANVLAEEELHHVAVVDAEGRAVGMLSALDVLRGMTGTPARHPSAFPGYDADLDVYWSQEDRLDVDHLDLAPNAPGVFVLIDRGEGKRDGVIWAEACDNVQQRLHALLVAPQHARPEPLARLLQRGSLRFRASMVPDDERRQHVAQRLRSQYDHLLPPQSNALIG